MDLRRPTANQDTTSLLRLLTENGTPYSVAPFPP